MILMPSELFNLDNPDPDFLLEYNAAREIFRIALYDHDEYVRSDSFISNIKYPLQNNRIRAMLRSWMLTKEQYTDVFNRLKKGNIDLINTPEMYINCHHYPMVHEIVKPWAPKTTWFTEITDEEIIKHREIIGGDMIIKDFVKSEKGNPDLFFLSKDLSNEEFITRVHRFIEARANFLPRALYSSNLLN